MNDLRGPVLMILTMALLALKDMFIKNSSQMLPRGPVDRVTKAGVAQ